MNTFLAKKTHLQGAWQHVALLSDQALPVIQSSPLARKLSAFVCLSEPEFTVLSNLYKRRRTLKAGADLVHQGQCGQSAYILASG